MTESGQRQAEALVPLFFERVPPELVLTSHDRATQDTAEPVLRRFQLKARKVPCHDLEGDETLPEMVDRATRLLSWLRRKKETQIVVFSHENFLRALSFIVRGVPIEDDFFQALNLPFCSIMVIERTEDGWQSSNTGLDAPLESPEDDEEEEEVSEDEEAEDEED